MKKLAEPPRCRTWLPKSIALRKRAISGATECLTPCFSRLLVPPSNESCYWKCHSPMKERFWFHRVSDALLLPVEGVLSTFPYGAAVAVALSSATSCRSRVGAAVVSSGGVGLGVAEGSKVRRLAERVYTSSERPKVSKTILRVSKTLPEAS